ncbi:PREDICTED: disabled homolog 2-like [Priapulus caudatus]|uniref:Disabled homolog 2-like n=1 Tax=Priapulus caudatus TaxID=37621 RepID=A0ABM1EJT1_PRICU|nr:PREDICTED: disabled homolog 2-like [Priapulus caudatus]
MPDLARVVQSARGFKGCGCAAGAGGVGEKSDPFRFQGEGVFFKAKIIGIDDVAQARGDQMCQESMQNLKAMHQGEAVRAQEEPRIGPQDRYDEKTNVATYSHKVHKISFIARDASDPRAFGYIVGIGDGQHKFFAIKTDKAAESLVVSIRDLFQTVFDMKKKEVEMAKQRKSAKEAPPGGSADAGDDDATQADATKNKAEGEDGGGGGGGGGGEAELNPATGSLLDLETELETMQQGIKDMNLFSGADDLFVVQSTPPLRPVTSDPFITSFTYSSSASIVKLGQEQVSPSSSLKKESQLSIGTSSSSKKPLRDDDFTTPARRRRRRPPSASTRSRSAPRLQRPRRRLPSPQAGATPSSSDVRSSRA